MNAHTHIDEDTTLMNVNEEDLKRAPNTLLICEEEWRLRYVFRVVLKHPFPCTSWVTFTLFLSSHNVLQFLEQTILKYLFYKYSFYALYPLAGMLRSFNFGFPNACELDIRDAYILSFSIFSENIFIHIKNTHTMHTYININTHPIFISKTYLYYFPGKLYSTHPYIPSDKIYRYQSYFLMKDLLQPDARMIL